METLKKISIILNILFVGLLIKLGFFNPLPKPPKPEIKVEKVIEKVVDKESKARADNLETQLNISRANESKLAKERDVAMEGWRLNHDAYLRANPPRTEVQPYYSGRGLLGRR